MKQPRGRQAASVERSPNDYDKEWWQARVHLFVDPDKQWWKTRLFWCDTLEHQKLARELEEDPDVYVSEDTPLRNPLKALQSWMKLLKHREPAKQPDMNNAPTVAAPPLAFFADETIEAKSNEIDRYATQPIPALK